MTTAELYRPTLLIGVGGTGIKIAERIVAEVRKTGVAGSGRIGVLPFDFDMNDLRAHVDPRDRDARLQLSTNVSIERLLDDNPGIEQAWFGPRTRLPPDILKMTLVDGAAQIRLLSRLGLYHAFTSGLPQALSSAVSRLGLLDGQTEVTGELNIMMVGSVAGATGSGTFMQLALAVRDACHAAGIASPILQGLFLLPDVFVRSAGLQASQVRNVLANGYAALKELNAVNDMANNLGTDTEFTFEYAPGQLLRKNSAPPFKLFTLIDFENISGGSYGGAKDAYPYLEVAVRAAFMLIFTPLGQKTASSSINAAQQRLAAAAQGRSNMYVGAGVSTIRYPAAEMCDYLTIRLAMLNLEGDWLRLDRSFARAMEEFRNRRQRGDLSATQPNRGALFLTDLRTLARSDRVAFFREIDTRLNPTVKDPVTGVEQQVPQYTVYVASLLKEIKTRFWAREALAKVAERRPVDVSQLPKVGIEDIVRRLEAELDADLREVLRTLESAPEDDFLNLMVTADDLGDVSWRDFHLQYYLVRGGPHLVEVRAFLYGLRQEIAAQRAVLQPSKPFETLMTAPNRFDETRTGIPATRHSPRVVETARNATRWGIVERLRGRTFDGFQSDYADYHATSRTALRSYSDQSVVAKVLDKLDAEASALLGYLERLFNELDAVFSRLRGQLDDEEQRHNPGRRDKDSNIWIYADAEAKRHAWAGLEKRTAGLRLDEDANRTLSASIYRQYREDQKRDKDHDYAALGGMFRTTIVDRFARGVVEASFRDGYDFSVIEAVKRDVTIARAGQGGRDSRGGEDWKDYLRTLINLARSQSQPFLTLVDNRKGDTAMLWSLALSLREEVADNVLFDGLFSTQPGEAPVEGAFDAREIVCLNSRVNLELTDLAKFYPGDPSRPAAPAEGSYAAAYRQRIEQLLDGEMATDPTGVSPYFTPHLDARWHRPGTLPEIFPEMNQRVREQYARGLAVALAEDLLKFDEHYGEQVTHFSTIGRGAGPSLARDKIVASWDPLTVARAFERLPELARAALAYWAAKMEAARSSRERAQAHLASMVKPAVPAWFLRIATDRADAERRDRTARRYVQAWASLVAELVDIAYSDLAPPGRTQVLDGLIDEARKTVFADLRTEQIRAETIRTLEQIFDSARDGLRRNGV